MRSVFWCVQSILPLLQKLSEISLDPYLIKWIRSYLAGRSHAVCKCWWLQLCHPTCTIRWPARLSMLFVSYINDVATAISSDSDVNMFAGDITRVDYIHSISTQLSLCHLYKIFTTSVIFHPYFLPGRPGHMLIDLFYSPNLLHGLTLISIPSYPMWCTVEQVT